MIKRLWWEKIPVKVRDYAQIFHRFLNFVPNIFLFKNHDFNQAKIRNVPF